jgi:hypothetical protein
VDAINHTNFNSKYDEEQTEFLKGELAGKGPKIHVGIVKKILNRKKVFLPILIDLFNNDEIWNTPYKKISKWTPITIIHIVPVMVAKMLLKQ